MRTEIDARRYQIRLCTVDEVEPLNGTESAASVYFSRPRFVRSETTSCSVSEDSGVA